jgi:hypothetical protein
MTERTSRRTVLGVVGAGVGAGAGGYLVFGGSDGEVNDTGENASDGSDDATSRSGNDSDETDDSGEPEEQSGPAIDGGAIVFTYDDGPMEDYEQAFPVHQEFDAPASTGIVTEWVGREDYMDTDWMDVEYIQELQDDGWEIMSHTTAHTALGEFALVEDVKPEETRLYPEEPHHGFQLGYDLEVTDGEQSVRRAVVDSGTDDIGRYLELEEPVGTSFVADETVERHPEDSMHEFLGESKAQLEAWGFHVDTLLAPYDVCDDWTVEVAREYYDGIANVYPGSMLNDPASFDPFGTNREYFIEFTTRERIQDQLDRVATEEALGIVGAHTFKDEVTEDRIREMFEWIEDRALEVITLSEAIEATSRT